MQYLVAPCNRPEGASEVISGKFVRPTVLEKCVQEKPTNCGTKAADVLANFLAGKL